MDLPKPIESGKEANRLPMLRTEERSYCTSYFITIHRSLIEELSWRKGDILEWRKEDDGLKLFLVRKTTRK